MATIGTFRRDNADNYVGTIETLTLKLEGAIFRKTDKQLEASPAFRLVWGSVEFGAAWQKTDPDGQGFLSVKLDDPTFPAPIYGRLIPLGDLHSLIWSRSRGST